MTKKKETELLSDVPCPICNGNGYTAEHACDGTDGMCAITCPQQVQCANCFGTGKIINEKP